MSCGICRWEKLLLLFFFFFFFTTDFKEEQQILWIGVEEHNSNTNNPMKLLVDLSEFSAPPRPIGSFGGISNLERSFDGPFSYT
jgi:hypothetical protein